MKNKKYVIVGTTLFVLVMLVGGLFMNKNSSDWSERNREAIEENVRNFVESYKLDPKKVEIERIHNPKKYPSGEESFMVYIHYYGEIYFSIPLRGNPDTLSISDPNDQIVLEIFNEIYLEALYKEFDATIDYLSSEGIEDPLRPENGKIKYLHTAIALNEELNSDIKVAFQVSNHEFDLLKKYIDENLEKIKRLDRIEIIGEKEGLDDEKAEELLKQLINKLPPSDYYLQIGTEDLSTGENQGLYKFLTVE